MAASMARAPRVSGSAVAGPEGEGPTAYTLAGESASMPQRTLENWVRLGLDTAVQVAAAAGGGQRQQRHREQGRPAGEVGTGPTWALG